MDIIELKATDLAAMLCSRVCHDLINPIGAIGNGLEVLGDPAQSEMAEGARDLIASAAKQSRAKLEFARLAYGASSTSGTDIDTRECERVARILFEIEKADLDWQVPLILLPKHKAKLLMNMLLIASMAVPRGGVVKAPPSKVRITIRLDEDVVEWFRDQTHEMGGGNYQTLINAALREYMESRVETLEETLRRVVREELRRKAR